MESIIEKYIDLIERCGKDGELHTFEYEAMLADSTIDKIVADENGNVLFYYNENTNDLDTIRAFSKEDLEAFYEELASKIKDDTDKEELIVERVKEILPDYKSEVDYSLRKIDRYHLWHEDVMDSDLVNAIQGIIDEVEEEFGEIECYIDIADIFCRALD